MNDSVANKPLHVVVVDDDSMVREATSMLVRSFGHEVIAFREAAPVLEHLQKNKCDVLITDFNMPGMSGIELLFRVKHDILLEHVVVAVHTGDDVREQVERNEGIFIPKPATAAVFEKLFDRTASRVK